MEVFYHQNSNNGIEWEQINDYLCSVDLQNVEIGLLLLEQNPQAVKYAEVGLNLLKYFAKNAYQERAQVLINSFLDRRKIEAANQLFMIFSEVAIERMQWAEFAKLLSIFELESNTYLQYIEGRPQFEICFVVLAHNLLKYNQDADKCWTYTNKVLSKNSNNLRIRMCWVELLMRHFLPKGQHRECMEELAQVLEQFYQQKPSLKQLMAYYLAVFYMEFADDRVNALIYLQYLEKTGIKPPFYGRVLAYLELIKAEN